MELRGSTRNSALTFNAASKYSNPVTWKSWNHMGFREHKQSSRHTEWNKLPRSKLETRSPHSPHVLLSLSSPLPSESPHF